MESTYGRPRSPFLDEPPPHHPVGNLPQSPDLSALQSPDNLDHCTGVGSPVYSHFAPPTRHFQGVSLHQAAPHAYSPTSMSQQSPAFDPHQQYYDPAAAMPPRRMKQEFDYGDGDYSPSTSAPATSRRTRGVKQEQQDHDMNGLAPTFDQDTEMKGERGEEPDSTDPTQGCQIKTSFPVARIKRIMQADEDIGKVAQVTPTVVSRALELFMIKLISAAAQQAVGPAGQQAGASKGPRRVLVQHLKKAVMADKKLDFLEEKVSNVRDAPTKKKDAGSDSEDAKPKKGKGKKRKDSGDDF